MSKTGPLPVAALLAVLLSADPTFAQTPGFVDPPVFAHLAGTRVTGYPFGYANRRSVRYLEIRDGLAGTPRSIRGIAWRRRGGGQVPAFDATCTVRLSTAPHAASSVSSTFGQNVGGDATAILSVQRVSFPVTVSPSSAPPTVLPDFEFRLPAAQPFLFGGLGSLCIDVEVANHTNRTNFTFDLYQKGRPHSGSFGVACGGTDLETTLTATEARHDSSGFPGAVPVLFFAGAPLPSPLDLSGFGAPGCASLVSQTVVLGGVADNSGRHSIAFPIGLARPGDSYACQTVAIADGLNPLGAVLTQASVVLPISPGGTSRVFADSAAATVGTAQPVFGLVVAIQ